jgi:hypothetical protein
MASSTAPPAESTMAADSASMGLRAACEKLPAIWRHPANPTATAIIARKTGFIGSGLLFSDGHAVIFDQVHNPRPNQVRPGKELDPIDAPGIDEGVGERQVDLSKNLDLFVQKNHVVVQSARDADTHQNAQNKQCFFHDSLFCMAKRLERTGCGMTT